MGAGSVHLQVHPLLLHRVHARQHLHAVGDVRGPLRGHRPRQEVLADPGWEARHARRGADLGAVAGHGSSRGALPEHRGAGEQQHLLLGGLAGPPEESLRDVHLRVRIPAAPHVDIRLLRKGGCAHSAQRSPLDTLSRTKFTGRAANPSLTDMLKHKYIILVLTGFESSSQKAEERLQKVGALQKEGRWGLIFSVLVTLDCLGASRGHRLEHEVERIRK